MNVNILFLSGMLFSIGLQAAQGQVVARGESAETHPYLCTAVYVVYDKDAEGFDIAAKYPKRFGDFPQTIKLPFIWRDELGRELHLWGLCGYGKTIKIDDYNEDFEGDLVLHPEFFGLRPRNPGVSTKDNPKLPDLSVDLSKPCYGFPCAGMFSSENTSERS